MAGREELIRAHHPKRSSGLDRNRTPPPARVERCPGAPAQLAAVHRTLRQGPVPQLRAAGAAAGAQQASAPRAAPANRSGLPDRLKAGVEALSGVSLDDVRVHYNSAKPAQLNALAYAQGSNIHLAPGQERHLPHEAWHVVQQKQGRVRATAQAKGVRINDEADLEREADAMGAMAAGTAASHRELPPARTPDHARQLKAGIEFETSIKVRRQDSGAGEGTNPETLRVGQNEHLFERPTWRIESDNSKLEFVTDPPKSPTNWL